jgi:hypothetical protein
MYLTKLFFKMSKKNTFSGKTKAAGKKPLSNSEYSNTVTVMGKEHLLLYKNQSTKGLKITESKYI